MYLKLQNKAYSILKLVHLIMPVLKSGKIIHMIVNLIFGHWDVYYMKWQHLNYHFKLRIWMDFLKKLSKVYFNFNIGFYPKLPITYSFDLQNLIRMML